MTFTPAKSNNPMPNRTIAHPAVNDAVFAKAVATATKSLTLEGSEEEHIRAAQQQKLQDDLRRQLKEEIGDDEDIPEKTMQALRQKFGLSNIPLTTTSLEKFWVRYEEGAIQ